MDDHDVAPGGGAPAGGAVGDELTDAVAGLDLATKVRLLTGATFWQTRPEASIGLRAMVFSDGPSGVRGAGFDERDPSLCLPSPTALAASWDVDLARRYAGALAAEARRKGVDVVLGPTVNLHRSPFGGRHFECFSEDPLLTGRMAAAYVTGLQAAGVGATVKHFVANDAETDRFTVDVRVGDRALRELYLAPFEAAVAAGAWLVMAAYNGVGGVTMTEHPLLADPLDAEWGFDGVVVSDWYATRSTEASAAAALDLVMPGPRGPWGKALVRAVREGRVEEAVLDGKLRRLLRLAARVGALGGRRPVPAPSQAPGAGRAAAREIAARGMVVLRNEGERPLLPFDVGVLRRVAVIGPNAAAPRVQGGGSAGVVPAAVVSPLEGLRAALEPAGVEVVHAPGGSAADGTVPAMPLSATRNPRTGGPGLALRHLDRDGGVQAEADRATTRALLLADPDTAASAFLEATTVYRAGAAGRHRLAVHGLSPQAEVRVDGKPVWTGELAVPDGEPAAALFAPPAYTFTRELAAGDEVELGLRMRTGPTAFLTVAGFGVAPPGPSPAELVAEAAEAARSCDVAVVVVGSDGQSEREGADRATLALPGGQDDLVRAVAAANPRTVVAVNAGAPVLLPWRDEVPAVLVTWFGGQELGDALADVLLGRAEPGGRLPTTWPAADAGLPAVAPVDGRLEYTEGIHVGYRGWLRSGAAPAYPFGHGLGYTTWTYLGLAAPATVAAGAGLDVVVRLRNSGGRAGREVVQVYLARTGASAVERPRRWLAGFAVVEAGPGDELEVAVRVEARAFQDWNGGWATEPGEFAVLAGRSVVDLPLRAAVTVTDG